MIVPEPIPNRLGRLLASDIPVVAVNYSDAVDDDTVRAAFDAGLDVAELRLDWFTAGGPEAVLARVMRFAAHPTLATIRIAEEGGDWRGSVEDRIALFRLVLPFVDGIDVELQTALELAPVIAEARALGRVVIVSTHDFEATPSAETLDDIADRSKATGADYVKIAALVTSPDDLVRLTSFTLRNTHLGLIVIGMGVQGSASRVFFPTIGSRLTYASGAQGRALSGQLAFADLFGLLRKFSPGFDEAKAAVARNRPDRP